MEFDIEQDIFCRTLMNLTDLNIDQADEIWYNLSDNDKLNPRTAAFKCLKLEKDHGQANNSTNTN
jgi:hypothetical protein